MGDRAGESAAVATYPRWSVTVVHVMLWAYATVGLAGLAASQVRGYQAIVPTMEALADAPEGFVRVINGTVSPLNTLLVATASDVVSRALTGVNDTVVNVVDPDLVVQSLDCVVSVAGDVPEPHAFVGFLEDIEDRQQQLLDAAAGIASALDQVAAFQVVLNTEADDVSTQVTVVGRAVSASRIALRNTSEAVAALTAATNELLNPVDGVAAVVTDLLVLAGGSGPGTALPSDAEIDSATIGTNSLATIQVVPKEPGGPLLTKLTALLNTIAALPDFSRTASNMQLYNTRVRRILDDDLVGRVQQSIEAVQVATSSVIGTADVLKASADASIEALNAVAVDDAVVALRHVHTVLAGIRFDAVSREIDKIAALPGGIPCIAEIANAIQRIWDDIIDLPPEVTVALQLPGMLNATLAPAAASIANTTVVRDAYVQQVDSLGILDKAATIERVASGLPVTSQSLGVDRVVEEVQTVEGQVATFASIAIGDQAARLKQALEQGTLSQTTIDAVRAVETGRQAALQHLRIITADLVVYNTAAPGVCSPGSAKGGQACSSASACGAGVSVTCIGSGAYVKRCRTRQSTLCLVDGDRQCTQAGDRCVVDPLRFSGAIAALQAFKHRPDVSDAARKLNDVVSHGQLDDGPVQAQISNADGILAQVSVADAQQQIAYIRAEATSFDAVDVGESLDALIVTIVGLQPALQAAKAEVLEFRGPRRQIADIVDLMAATSDMIRAMRDLMYIVAPGILEQLSAPALEAARQRSGLGGIAVAVATAFDQVNAFLYARMSAQFGDTRTQFAADIAHTASRLQVMSTPRYYAHGPLHFAGSLLAGTAVMDADSVTSPDAKVTVDGHGVAYPEARVCLTSRCISNSLRHWEDQPVLEANFGRADSAPLVTVSVRQLGVYPYIALALTILPAVAASLSSRRLAGNCGSRLACASMCSIAITTPLLMLMFGPLWSGVMLVGDFCYGVENSAVQVLRLAGNESCSWLPEGRPVEPLLGADGVSEAWGGPGGAGVGGDFSTRASSDPSVAGLCEFTVRVPSPLTTRLDLDKAAQGLLGGDCALVPLQDLWDGVEQSAAVLPRQMLEANVLNKTVPWRNAGDDSGGGGNGTASSDASSRIALRPAVRRVLEDAADSLSGHASRFVSGVRDSVACPSVHSAYRQVKDALCCDTLDTLFWTVGGVYMLGVANVALGCGASLLAVKRFSATLWGPEVPRALERFREAQLRKRAATRVGTHAASRL